MTEMSRAGRRTWMSRDAVARVRAEGLWGNGEWPDVDPAEVPYGASWEDLRRFRPLGVFLQAAALAGQVNAAAIDGAVAVLNAHHVDLCEDLVASRTRGRFTEALCFAIDEACGYRAIAVMLERRIDELERMAVDLLHSAGAEVETSLPRARSDIAVDAEERADRARERIESLRRDALSAREVRASLLARVLLSDGDEQPGRQN